MSGENTETTVQVKSVLDKQLIDLLAIRAAFWDAGKADAALAVDDARHSISRALHDLRRAESHL